VRPRRYPGAARVAVRLPARRRPAGPNPRISAARGEDPRRRSNKIAWELIIIL